ncbi:MAG: hypothetical protein V1725_02590 [archaeon]
MRSFCLDKTELNDTNSNLASAYLAKADNALNAAKLLVSNKEWQVCTLYYAMYFGVYALLRKAGVRCENHACTIFIAERFFTNFSAEDILLLKQGMRNRVDEQYFPDRPVSAQELAFLLQQAPRLVLKCKA